MLLLYDLQSSGHVLKRLRRRVCTFFDCNISNAVLDFVDLLPKKMNGRKRKKFVSMDVKSDRDSNNSNIVHCNITPWLLRIQ